MSLFPPCIVIFQNVAQSFVQRSSMLQNILNRIGKVPGIFIDPINIKTGKASINSLEMDKTPCYSSSHPNQSCLYINSNQSCLYTKLWLRSSLERERERERDTHNSTTHIYLFIVMTLFCTYLGRGRI